VRSHLLEGKVHHRRARPFTYGLEHDVWYAALDLAELDHVDRRLRLLSRNGRNVVEFRDADHMPEPALDVRAALLAHLAAEGMAAERWQVTLITNVRVLGYVFNPASFFLCRDESGALRLVVIEVHNTFGDRHLYTLRPSTTAEPAGEAQPFVSAMTKDFFVSPFISMDGHYQVHVRDMPDGLRLAINLRQDGAPMLSTSLVLRRRLLTDRMLLRMLTRHPFVTHKTIALIHLHGIRLWRRGAPFFRHGDWARGTMSAQ
jgi:DUF1365 family protein